MQAAGCDTFGDYLDFLEVHPAEFARLFDALRVTAPDFSRAPPVWERLREVAIPQLLHGRPADDPIRVWSAGCATGQEACTIAMVLCEALGEDDYRDRVKIYGTDVDEQALAVARATTYAERDMESLPEGLRDRGVMLLGKSEMMLAQSDRFDPIDPRHRIFRRLDHRAGLQDQIAEVVRGGRIDWPARE